jgi:cell division septum initiation protein DivIVA
MGGGEPKRTKSPEPGREQTRANREPASPNGESVVESAERAAAKIRADAEAEADRYLEKYKRRVDEMFEEKSRVADELVEQAAEIKKHYERFMGSVEVAVESDNGDDLPSWPEPDPGPSTPTRGGFRPRPATSEKISARALVAQMTAAGADREAVSKSLREEYGIRDPSTLLKQFEL